MSQRQASDRHLLRIPSDSAPARRSDALWLALAALGLYLLLGQATLYKFDGHYILQRAQQGQIAHPWHVLTMPILWLVHAAGTPLGLSWYRAGTVACALGTALGVGFMHLATCELRLGRKAALATTALIAGAPAVVFFATIVEHHGIFFAFAGLACWAAARLAVRTTLARGVWFGLAAWLAYLGHGSGSLLAFWLLPLVFLLAQEPRWSRGRVRVAGLALLVNLVLIAASPWIVGLFGGGLEHKTQLAVATHEGWHALTPLGLTIKLCQEWLEPYLPISVFGLLGLGSARTRPFAIPVVLGLCPYLLLARLVLGDDIEFGAYFLPLAWPAALATVLLARWSPWLLLALSLALGVARVRLHDDHTAYDTFISGLRSVVGTQPAMVFAGSHDEVGACLVQWPDLPCRVLIEESNVDPGAFPSTAPLFATYLRELLAQGTRVFLTVRGRDWLTHPMPTAAGPSGPLLADYLARNFDLRAVDSGGFHALELH